MDRLFLDANVLFSAAYRPGAGLLELWNRTVSLCSSRYALAEATTNLEAQVQRERLHHLAKDLSFFEAPTDRVLPPTVILPKKDIPILLAAIAGRASHLLTGDIRDFGHYFGKRIEGVRIMLPGDYLRKVRS